MSSDLTLRDIIDVLCEFSLQHTEFIYYDEECDGVCLGDKRHILISKDQMLDDKRKTVIHELIHAKDLLTQPDSNERSTVSRTNKVYKELYGEQKRGF